jgi:lipopolysaccharide/colanic/teichoic acid biosynthesis glycosyltransferase
VTTKRCFDVLASLTLLALLLPVLLLVALAVLVTSGPPTIHRATRVGRGGAHFRMLKFRTMVVGATGPLVTGADDTRVTGVGRLLRRTKLDELPQLVNVLRGDMSLVGPRPEDPHFVALWTDAEREVLTVRPGITSTAALAYRDEEELLRVPRDQRESLYVDQVMRAKLALDLDYVRGRSLGLDLVVLWRTLLAVAPAGWADRPGQRGPR